ncbi:MAG: polymer-forming cytoskeletal protein [Anaerovorax sp.]
MDKKKLPKGFSNLGSDDNMNPPEVFNEGLVGDAVNTTPNQRVEIKTEKAVSIPEKKAEVAEEPVVEKEVPIQEVVEPEENRKIEEEPVSVSEMAIIGKNTVIKGAIYTKGHARIEGTIEGSIQCEGNLKLNGKISGDIQGGNIELQSCEMKGNLAAKGGIIIGEGIVLNGDIAAEKLILDGAVRGNLKIEKDAHLSENAVVEGSIEAGKLTMIAGAKVQGHMSIR